jgi:cellulose synthase/poly-beta-1,6-N-acetylglucosamine synthase-like glycosyltransferase
MTIQIVLAFAASVVASMLAFMTVYLLVLSLAAFFGRATQPPRGPGGRRFAVLIPAHNEEQLIGRLLRSLHMLDYAPHLFDVCVVADNCTDRTAEVARALGARVYERFDDTLRAKGFALQWLLKRLRDEGSTADAFVVLDADSVVEANLLRAFDAHLESGGLVIQAHYSVLNASDSAVAGLRYAALAAVHYLRPLGRSVLGLSAGLKGNGMCFAAPILDRFDWQWFTLAEDVEFHLALVDAGVRVAFASETTVRADMPITLAQASSQNQRWERGRLQLIRQHVPRLILHGIRKRSALRLDAAIEQLMPPLSVPFVLAAACFVLAASLGDPTATVLSAASLLGQMAYVIGSLVLVRAPLRAYLSLSTAPVYIAWKFGLYGRALLTARAGDWVRTARVSTPVPPVG